MNTVIDAVVRVDELGTASALALARERGDRVDAVRFPDGTTLELARVADVLYVPSALERGQSLQIVGGRNLAMEAVFDDFTAGFVRQRLARAGVERFEGFVDAGDVGDVCILGNVFSRNFTHWHEELMKVVAVERTGRDCRYVVSALPDFARALLAIVGIPAERILEVDRPTRFAAALHSTPVSYRNVADYPAVLDELRERVLACPVPAGTPAPGPRLWLDRGAQTRLGRSLVNGEEVQRLLEAHDFVRVDMGSLPLPAQVDAARHMRVLAGLHGSQFVHSQLMPRGSLVIECFSPLYLNPTYVEIYRVLRHRSALIAATNTPLMPYLHGGDVLVDIQQLALALQSADAA